MINSDTVVVLPTYNEVENIRTVFSRIRAVSSADILFVDDGSTDGSVELINDLISNDSGVKALFRGKKMGLGSAYRDAYTYAINQRYKYLIQCDADGSHEIEKIPKIIEAAEAGFELVIGSRYVKGGSIIGWPKSRELISRFGNLYSRINLGLKTKDNTAGFRLYKLTTLAQINYKLARANGYAFQVQMTYLFKNQKTLEIPIKFIEREFGKSKMTFGIALEALIEIPLLRFK